jgi:hypothetical protein
MRQASVLVADEFAYTLSGKFNIFGIYTSDIYIVGDPTVGSQLIFVFLIETSPDDPYQNLELRVELPGGDFRRLSLGPLSRFVPEVSDQRRWSLKYPLLFVNPILRPGPIEATVIHEAGVISTATPFIVVRPPATPS